MLRGDTVGKQSVTGCLALVLRLRFSLLRAEVAVGSPLLARIGLVTLAMALQTLAVYSPGHFRPSPTAAFALFVPLATITSLLACLLATLPLKRLLGLRTRQMLCLAAFASSAVLAVIGIGQAANGVKASLTGQPYTNDGAVMDLYAAQQVLHGHNPYLKTNIVAALAAINAPCSTTTPLMDGQFRGVRAYPSETAVQQVCMDDLRLKPRKIPPEFESKYNYPAGSFVFILPFVWGGIYDMRFLYALAVLAMGWYIALRLPRALRPLVPLLLLGNVPLIVLTSGGQPDPMYGLFLLLAYAEWDRPRLSPIAMGLAIATKQLAWFFLPFYLLLVVRRLGWRQAGWRVGIMTAIFLLLNAPFILRSPVAYISSIAAPMSDPMFPLGIGAIALFVANVLPPAPKLAFTVAEIAGWVAAFLLKLRVRSLPPAAVPVLAVIPLFFAWRSLVNYFYLAPLLTLAILLAERQRRERGPRRA